MPIKKNTSEQNSNRRSMSVPNMHFEVSKDNKRVLEILDTLEAKKQKKWWRKKDE